MHCIHTRIFIYVVQLGCGTSKGTTFTSNTKRDLETASSGQVMILNLLFWKYGVVVRNYACIVFMFIKDADVCRFKLDFLEMSFTT